MRKINLKNTPRKNAVQLFNWMHANCNFEELEKNNWLEIYYSGMKWFETNLGNAGYVELSEEDIECLLTLHSSSKTMLEISNITGISIQALKQKLFKLTTRGLIIPYNENKSGKDKVVYYKLSLYGKNILIEKVTEQTT